MSTGIFRPGERLSRKLFRLQQYSVNKHMWTLLEEERVYKRG